MNMTLPVHETTVPTNRLSPVSLLLRAEGAAIFIGAVALYAHQGGSFWLFLALIFLPDLSMIGYLANPRLGSLTYNLVHTLVTPVIVAAFALVFNLPTLTLVALILFAHIGIDRMFGYGLKYPTAFKDTHMQHV